VPLEGETLHGIDCTTEERLTFARHLEKRLFNIRDVTLSLCPDALNTPGFDIKPVTLELLQEVSDRIQVTAGTREQIRGYEQYDAEGQHASGAGSCGSGSGSSSSSSSCFDFSSGSGAGGGGDSARDHDDPTTKEHREFAMDKCSEFGLALLELKPRKKKQGRDFGFKCT
jgi:uncharacterized membrane protein YgcG